MYVVLVLQQYCKLNEQMEKKQYYSALKTLEQLEHTFLPPVKGYIFSDLLCKEVPKIRRSIEDQSNTELTVSYLIIEWTIYLYFIISGDRIFLQKFEKVPL